jgi:hypothetical protein
MNAMAHYQNQNQTSRNSNDPCPDFMTMAERELSAFFKAVMRTFGSEQAALSAQDWLRELVEVEGLPASVRDWRLITAKASTRLAGRVNASSLSSSLWTESQIA